MRELSAYRVMEHLTPGGYTSARLLETFVSIDSCCDVNSDGDHQIALV